MVEADRVGPVRGPGGEHALFGPGQVVAWARAQDVAVGAIEPGENDDLRTGDETVEAVDNRAVEGEPRVGSTLVTLARRVAPVHESRLDEPDRSKFDHDAVTITFDDLPQSAAWRHEAARDGFETVFIRASRGGWNLSGHSTAVEAGAAWAVRYDITVDRRWRTRSARVWTSTSEGTRRSTLTSDGAGHWAVNGHEASELAGCADVDLEASACTNTLPLHRSPIAVGATLSAPAAYVRVHDGMVEKLEQTYARTAALTYDYQAPRFDFRCALTYDASGLLLRYPGIATRIL